MQSKIAEEVIVLRMWFKKIRESKGLTQSKIAEHVGVTRQFIGMIENGTANPHPETAKAIADLLEFDWTEFFKEVKHSA
jgi:transcriptional regulator with XRE-family HTH domain